MRVTVKTSATRITFLVNSHVALAAMNAGRSRERNPKAMSTSAKPAINARIARRNSMIGDIDSSTFNRPSPKAYSLTDSRAESACQTVTRAKEGMFGS